MATKNKPKRREIRQSPVATAYAWQALLHKITPLKVKLWDLKDGDDAHNLGMVLASYFALNLLAYEITEKMPPYLLKPQNRPTKESEALRSVIKAGNVGITVMSMNLFRWDVQFLIALDDAVDACALLVKVLPLSAITAATQIIHPEGV